MQCNMLTAVSWWRRATHL